MAIYFYKEFGELGYLANYSNHGFEKNGVYYKTVEHYYQSQKFLDLELRKKVIEAETPKEASNIGRDRNHPLRKNWKEMKQQVMLEGVLAKFRSHPTILQKLIETRNEEIIENTIDEYYWGCGKDKTGENNFGKILCHAREILKQELFHRIFDWEALKKLSHVYVIGHMHPDADSIFSSYLLSNIFCYFGVKASFSILANDTYANDDKKLIDDFLPESPIIITESDDKVFFLVDHNDYDQSVGNKCIIGSIDHHVYSGKVSNTFEIEYASTGLLIFDLFKDIYPFSDLEKQLVAYTVLADTEYLVSTRYRESDASLYQSLNVMIDLKNFQKKYFMTTDFNRSVEENFFQNYKKYVRDIEINKVSFKVYREDERYLHDYLIHLKTLSGTWLFIWAYYDYPYSEVYLWQDGKLTQIIYDYTVTSAVLTIKDLEKRRLI